MNKSSENYRPHTVDEEAKIVYLNVRSWAGAVSASLWVESYYPGYECVLLDDKSLTEQKQMTTPKIELTIAKNELGLFQADAVLQLSTLSVRCMKADRDDLKYQLQNDFREIVEEIVSQLIKDEF